MIESIITLLITICVIAILIYVVIWVLGLVGIVLPDKVVQLLWVIFALIVLLLILRIVMSGGGLHLGKWSYLALTAFT